MKVVDALASLGLKQAKMTFETFLRSTKHRACPVLPSYLYCSGHYVMAAGLEWTDERQPAHAPCNPGSAWRRAIEDAVLTSPAVNGAVIRPVCLYGRGGGYFGSYHFRPALDAIQKSKRRFESIVGTSGKIATVHCDDAGELFVAVAERVSPPLPSALTPRPPRAADRSSSPQTPRPTTYATSSTASCASRACTGGTRARPPTVGAPPSTLTDRRGARVGHPRAPEAVAGTCAHGLGAETRRPQRRHRRVLVCVPAQPAQGRADRARVGRALMRMQPLSTGSLLSAYIC